jgi:hypothetical protein
LAGASGAWPSGFLRNRLVPALVRDCIDTSISNRPSGSLVTVCPGSTRSVWSTTPLTASRNVTVTAEPETAGLNAV